MKAATRVLALLALTSICGLVAVSSANGNTVPSRTRSSYGEAASTILSTTSFLVDGVKFDAESFCADAQTNSDGTCALSFAYQVAGPLPSGTTSMTITLPVPSGTSPSTSFSPVGIGILTNDSGFAGANVFFSPFSSADLAGLPDSAITFPSTVSNSPFITFSDPITNLPGGGNGLSLFLDLTDNNSVNGDGLFCFEVTSVCTATDVPSIPAPEVELSATQTAPEPSALLTLVSGLGLLGLYRRRS